MVVVALSSGGLDSSVMMLLLLREGYSVMPLHVNYGQLSEKYEWSSCQKVASQLDLPKPERIDVPDFGKSIPSRTTSHSGRPDPYVPYRNLLLLTIGAAYAHSKGSHSLAIGFLANSSYSDQSSYLAKAAQKAIERSHDIGMRVVTPLIKLNKVDVVQLACRFGFPIDITRSCYYGRKKPCGRCPACRERDLAISVLERHNNAARTR